MIILKDKKEVIDIYKEAGRPLSKEMETDLNEIQAELEQKKLPTDWAIIEIKCRICNYECVSIVPAIADLDSLECGNCGNMSCQEKELEDWQE